MIGCVLIVASAVIASVAVIKREQDLEPVDAADENRKRSGSRSGRDRPDGKQRSKRHPKRKPRSKTPTVIKQTTGANNDVTVSKITLADDVPVTVVCEDTGDKFTAL